MGDVRALGANRTAGLHACVYPCGIMGLYGLEFIATSADILFHKARNNDSQLFIRRLTRASPNLQSRRATNASTPSLGSERYTSLRCQTAGSIYKVLIYYIMEHND